jgi:glycosyltransferase involved in cell wall biosynthesis
VTRSSPGSPRRRPSVVFYSGESWERWSPESIDGGGIGGSEAALAQIAVRLPSLECEVHVYADCEPGVYGGSEWRRFEEWNPAGAADLLVVSRLPHLFDVPLAARRRVFWCHEHSYPGELTPARAERMTDIVVLSEWQRQRFARLYPYAAHKLRVIRNGIDVNNGFEGADRRFGERAPRCVYSSSFDRGLEFLLELWPLIRERVPAAELHVFYGWNTYDAMAAVYPSMNGFKERIAQLIAACGGEDGGVAVRGRVGQGALHEEMTRARVWTYPTDFLEVSCIGGMEARAAGLAVVTSRLAALVETVGEHGTLVSAGIDEKSPNPRHPEYRRAFVDRVAELLADESEWSAAHAVARSGWHELGWDRRAVEWTHLLP